MTFLKCSNSSLTMRDSSAVHVLDEDHFGKATKPSTEAYFYPTAEFYIDFCSASQMGLGDFPFLFSFFTGCQNDRFGPDDLRFTELF